MPRRPRPRPSGEIVADLRSRLDALERRVAGVALRDDIGMLVAMQRDLDDLGLTLAKDAGIDARAAKDRLLQYLIACVGQKVTSAELRAVAGISEFARRVRQLRVEDGYQIASGASPDPAVGLDLRPDDYVLVDARPDADASRRWSVANAVRRTAAGTRERILAFLQQNVGQVVTTEELAYVAADAREFARRVRELRTEEGWLIATRFTGRPDLRMGQYVLESAERRAEPHDRHVPDAVQRRCFERDGNVCRACGWSHVDWTRDDPRILELHHVVEHARGGPNTEDNLVVVCNRCHDDIHASRRPAPPAR